MINCTETPELIELCERCTQPDCTGDRGCETYKALKKKIARQDKKAAQPAPAEDKHKKPAMELEIVPEMPVECTAETLRKCNAAIAALEALQDDGGCDMIFDSVMIGDLLQNLKETRIREYESLIDWDAIAERMK